jgi:hypothetical protein
MGVGLVDGATDLNVCRTDHVGQTRYKIVHRVPSLTSVGGAYRGGNHTLLVSLAD